MHLSASHSVEAESLESRHKPGESISLTMRGVGGRLDADFEEWVVFIDAQALLGRQTRRVESTYRIASLRRER